MKKLKFLGLMLLVTGLVLFTGCSGTEGPAGPQGLPGPQGAPGNSGPDWSMYSASSANAAVRNMVTGFNLGNTFDMCRISVDGKEICTDFPPTTQDNIRTLRAHGFNAIRLPVTWSNAIKETPSTYNNFKGNYQLHPTYLNRIEEVVNWIIGEGMYCIMDSHHTDGIFGNFGLYDKPRINANGVPQTIAVEEAARAMRHVYYQVAERFKNTSHLLIIEALNEPKCQQANADGVQPNTWGGGTAEQHRNLNYLYQVFLDTIRESGGMNTDRLLAFPTYAASATELAMNGLTLPTDLPQNRGLNNKLIVDIHAYNPYLYALAPDMATQPRRPLSGDYYYTDWTVTSTHQDTGPLQMNETLNLAMKYFVNKGIPVIWGEVSVVNRYKDIYVNAVRTAVNDPDGAPSLFDTAGGLGNYVRTKTNTVYVDEYGISPRPTVMDWSFNHQSRYDWTKYFWSEGKERGIPFFWWDNGHLFYTAADGGTTATSRFTYLTKADGSQVVVPGRLGASINGNNEFNVLINRYENNFPYPYLLRAIQEAVGLPVTVGTASLLDGFNPDVAQPDRYWDNATAINGGSGNPAVAKTGWDNVPNWYPPFP